MQPRLPPDRFLCARLLGLPKSRPDLLDAVCVAVSLPPAVRLLFQGESWNLDTAVQCATPLIATARAGRVDAIIAFNDVAAVGWHLAARQQGSVLPVIGFDGSPLIKAWRPALPYVDLQSDTLARTAVALLGDLMKGETPPRRHTQVRPTFVAIAG